MCSATGTRLTQSIEHQFRVPRQLAQKWETENSRCAPITQECVGQILRELWRLALLGELSISSTHNVIEIFAPIRELRVKE